MLPNRRDFLLGATTTAAAGLAWSNRRRGALAAEAPPETTRVTIARGPSLCTTPQYVVHELLADEGITRVDYIVTDSGPLLSQAIASGQVDFAMTFSGPLVLELDRGKRITMLAGVHVGCFELFGNERVRSIADLKGKSVGVQGLGSSPYVFLAAMAAHVGLDPVKDIHWVINADPSVKPIERSRKERSMPFSVSHPNRRSCAPGISGR
jgi:NitT/TauT family transport system substrate-binding protein